MSCLSRTSTRCWSQRNHSSCNPVRRLQTPPNITRKHQVALDVQQALLNYPATTKKKAKGVYNGLINLNTSQITYTPSVSFYLSLDSAILHYPATNKKKRRE
jgi:hypothetical protein